MKPMTHEHESRALKAPPFAGGRGRKRICFVTTLHATLHAFVRPQTECLLDHGWEVTWVCASANGTPVPVGTSHVVMPFKRGIDPFGIPRAILALYRLFRRERFDIVQYSTPNAAFYASTAAWLARVPVRLYAQWGIRYVGFQGGARSLFKLLEGWCCCCSTLIEPDSQSNLEFSIQEGLYPREKGRVIWNGSASGVDLNRFDVTQKGAWRAAFRKNLGLDESHLVIGFVGSIRRDKGCNELIAACRQLFGNFPNARLLLVGDKQFYDTIDGDLRGWVKTSGQVIHVPANQEIPQYLASMDVFSLPSYREGFGTVIIEAEAMGLPVVVSDVPGPIDAMCPHETGVVVPVADTNALASALLSLLEHPEIRMAYGLRATEFVRDHFEQKEHCTRVLQDKEELLWHAS